MTLQPRRVRGLLAAILCIVAGAFARAVPASEITGVARGHGGAVASAEPASTAVGLEILRRGGNAADAAVATALAMAVVHPQAGNLGGGGFAVVRFGGSTHSLDFRETAPGRAARDMYIDGAGMPVAGASTIGPLAAGVPGSPAGLEALHRRFGVLPWADVVAPARRLADEGFIVSGRLAEDLREERDLLTRFAETSAVWLRDGAAPRAGTRIRLPELAGTLEIYGRLGARGIQTGEIAARIVEASRRHGGILEEADLAGYEAQWRPALEFESFGWRFAAMDLPSSGGYLLAAALGMAERLDWSGASQSERLRPHLLAEIWRRVFADRTQFGDPSSTRVTAAILLDSKRLDALTRSVDRDRATKSSSIRGWPTEPAPTGGSPGDETVHLSVIDRDTNVVALTTTLNGIFGCGLLVPGGGFFLNNEMDDFSTAPGHPNMFGLIQGPANEVAPGRRMLSSMTPVLGRKGDEILALGGRGGARIPTALAQVLLGILVDGDDLESAVARPRIHHQWLPDEVWMEEGALSADAVADLEGKGHTVVVNRRNAKVNAVRRFADGSLVAVGDPRGPASGGVLEPLETTLGHVAGSRRYTPPGSLEDPTP
jgi:gamma-glutamyltranspeptidase/glutathione hydrolase